jgi:hypothetical protein
MTIHNRDMIERKDQPVGQRPEEPDGLSLKNLDH